jgi:hypothetical protein
VIGNIFGLHYLGWLDFTCTEFYKGLQALPTPEKSATQHPIHQILAQLQLFFAATNNNKLSAIANIR